jgi:hypothetical protein
LGLEKKKRKSTHQMQPTYGSKELFPWRYFGSSKLLTLLFSAVGRDGMDRRTAMARVRETLGALLGLAGFLLVSVQGGSFAAFVWRGWDGGGQRQRRVAFVFPFI